MGRRPLVTRTQVLEAARKLFAERGYGSVSLAQIGDQLGISAAAVLRHAPTKEALFKEAFTIPGEIKLPMDILPEVDVQEDPRKVLRNLALEFIPFIQSRLGEQVAMWMHARTAEDAQHIAGFLREPFGKSEGLTPPRRALKLLEDYFRRLSRAGRMKVKDPQAAALHFIASMHAYVTLHQLVRILEPPMQLNRYLDALIEIWTNGAISAGRSSR